MKYDIPAIDFREVLNLKHLPESDDHATQVLIKGTVIRKLIEELSDGGCVQRAATVIAVGCNTIICKPVTLRYDKDVGSFSMVAKLYIRSKKVNKLFAIASLSAIEGHIRNTCSGELVWVNKEMYEYTRQRLYDMNFAPSAFSLTDQVLFLNDDQTEAITAVSGEQRDVFGSIQ